MKVIHAHRAITFRRRDLANVIAGETGIRQGELGGERFRDIDLAGRRHRFDTRGTADLAPK